MKTAIVSYSMTGNNEVLARHLARSLGADHFQVKEGRKRTNVTIVLDLLLHRMPEVTPLPEKLSDYELIVVMGPVWMGKLATPLRAYLKYLKTHLKPLVYISISGGADGPNPLLREELIQRAGREPLALIDLHIADLLPKDPKPTRADTSSYRLTPVDAEKLTAQIKHLLPPVIASHFT